MDTSRKRRLVLSLVMVLGIISFSASGGAGGTDPRGKGYPAATFYVA